MAKWASGNGWQWLDISTMCHAVRFALCSLEGTVSEKIKKNCPKEYFVQKGLSETYIGDKSEI